MISIKYKNAYKEVLILLNHISKEEYSKIPKEKISYMMENQNDEYAFEYDKTLPLNEQNISREANAIILNLFDLYFASDIQKEKLRKILKSNELKYEKAKLEKYNPDNLFKKSKVETQNLESTLIKEETAIIEYKEKNFLQKIFDKIKHLFKKN